MVRRWVVPVAVLALVAGMHGSVRAAPAPEGRGYGGKVSTTTTPGGATTVTSGKVPKSVHVTDVFLGEEIGDTRMFTTLTFTLMHFSTKKDRTVACALFAAHQLDTVRDEVSERGGVDPGNVEVIANTKVLATAAMCMRMVRLMAEIEAEQPSRARRAARGCDALPIALKVRTERTEDGGYRMVTDGPVTNGATAIPARVTCKGSARKVVAHVVPKKHRTLRSAVGANVIAGVVSPSDAEDDAHVTVGFRKRS